MVFSLFSVLLFSLVDFTAARANVSTSVVTYASGKDTIQAYLCTPDGDGPFPAIILIHEWWGLNDWIKENARSLAAEGYVTLAIDLYRGQVVTTPDEARQLSRGVPENRAAQDLQAAFNFLKGKNNVTPTRIGSLGWCMGGGYSLEAALYIPQLAACTICYGRLVTDSSLLQKISCPILGIFGEEDKVILPPSVREFETACKQAGKSIDVKIYKDSGHAFMNPDNKGGYNESSAKDAWARITTFFDQTLRR